MKFVATLLLSLSFVVAAHASDGPAVVVSTTNKIPQFNPQHSALSIGDLCQKIAKGDLRLDWGKSKPVTCTTTIHGLVKITAENSDAAISVYANSSDMTVVENMGTDIIHRYTNDVSQSLTMHLVFVATGVGQTSRGTVVNGTYRVDMLLNDGVTHLRVGYFGN